MKNKIYHEFPLFQDWFERRRNSLLLLLLDATNYMYIWYRGDEDDDMTKLDEILKQYCTYKHELQLRSNHSAFASVDALWLFSSVVASSLSVTRTESVSILEAFFKS